MREPIRTIFLMMVIILSFAFTKACEQEANAMQPVPLVVDPTYGKLIWEAEDGKVQMYRIVDHVEGLTVICYPLVGKLHGKTVSNFCIYRASNLHNTIK